MKHQRASVRWAAAGLAGLFLLAGCGGLAPGTAASVGGHTIPMSQVEDLAQAQCAAAEHAGKQGNVVTMPISQVQQQSLGLLMDTELSRQFGKARGVTPNPDIVKGFFQQFESGIQPLPEKARTELAEVFRDWAEGRAALAEVGSRKTGQQPDFLNLEKLINEGLVERQKWAADVDIETDPRFAPGENGFPGSGDGSVSKPVSDFAKSATASRKDPAWVSALPAGQKCG